MSSKESYLTDDYESLLDLLLEEEGLSVESTSQIQPREEIGPVPLTTAQSRIWFLEELEPGTSSFLIPTAIRFRIPIDLKKLTDAYHAIWQRHAILNTTIFEEDGQHYQQPGDFAPPPLYTIDLTHLEPTEREETILNEVTKESITPFDLENEPLIRATILLVQPEENIFLLTMHHVISDGWSVNLLLREILQVYMQKLHNQGGDLPSLEIDYADYAVWQKEWLTTPEVLGQLDYWKEQLQEPLPITELPTDYARPVKQTHTGAQQSLTLSSDLHQSLRQLNQKAGTTLYMTLMAAFKVLLSRHIGHDDIIIGSPIAGRQRPELEPLVGIFLNTLVLRTNLEDAPTFSDVLTRVRTTCVDAFANQDVPFEQLLMELLPSRDTSRTPFFQIFFNMLQFDDVASDFDFAAEFIDPPELSTKFDMTLYLAEQANGIRLTLVYNRDLFSEAKMIDFLEQYQLLLEQVVDNPNLPLHAYSLLTAAAQSSLPDPTQLLSNKWEGPIFERLDKWANKQPKKTAVSDPKSRWSYQALSDNSNRLAHALHDQGVAPGQVVAIYAHRSAALVCAIMGVMKAGGITLILDPKYPAARLQQYTTSAQPTAWISFSQATPPPADLAASLKTFAGKQPFTLPASPKEVAMSLAAYPNTPLDIVIQPDDIASLTFTSGSTGEPKGVAGRHRSLTHFYPWMAEKFELTSTDRFSMLSGLAHDPLQRDIFTALWVGAEICVPDPNVMWQPGYLGEWLQEARISVAHLIPSMIQALTTSKTKTAVLRYALFVGEPLTRHLSEHFRKFMPSVTIINLFGASETQRAVSYYLVEPDTNSTPKLKQEIPLGTGMPDVQLLVLTEQTTVAGIGELGELYMRSPHLAAGYWQDPQKTTEKFIVSPLSHQPEDIFYRTGDYGRFLADGQVEFVGRLDSQVNIRGFRVELGEIEAALVAESDVKGAVVTLANDAALGDYIVAYIVKETLAAPIQKSLQDRLKEKLPAPMIPAAIMPIDKIPLTPNGKIDSRALPTPDRNQDITYQYTPPRNEVEQMLVTIWQDVLNKKPISIHDNFFALGGHSLIAIRLFSEIEAHVNKKMPLSILFEAPTIAELAIRIMDDEWVSDSSVLVPIQTKGYKPPFFYVAPYSISVLQMSDIASCFEERPFFGIQPLGLSEGEEIHTSIEDMAAYNIEAIRNVQPHGPYFLGGHCTGAWVAYEMASQLEQMGESVAYLAIVDSPAPTYHEPSRNSIRHQINRLLYYVKDHRLIFALGWKLKLHAEKKLLSRLGSDHQKRIQAVRDTHHDAFGNYTPPHPYSGPMTIVRSSENMLRYNSDDWYKLWQTMPSQETDIVDIHSTHAMLVFNPQAHELAQNMLTGIDQATR